MAHLHTPVSAHPPLLDEGSPEKKSNMKFNTYKYVERNQYIFFTMFIYYVVLLYYYIFELKWSTGDVLYVHCYVELHTFRLPYFTAEERERERESKNEILLR